MSKVFDYFQGDPRIIFKDYNLWLFIDFEQDVKNEDEIELPVSKVSKLKKIYYKILLQKWLNTLDMLLLSDAKFAKSVSNSSGSSIDWILFDVYKVAPHFPLEISAYGYVFNRNTIANIKNSIYQTAETARVRIADKFLSKSVRDDLKGLRLTCGLVVCTRSMNHMQKCIKLIQITITLYIDPQYTSPELFTYLEDPKVENIDIFTKATYTIAANMRENLNMRFAC